MAIKIGTKIERLNPGDTYPLMDANADITASTISISTTSATLSSHAVKFLLNGIVVA